jgi:Ku protein
MAPRAYWKGYLRLSLVTCPIELFPATSQSEKTHFHQINTQTGHRLRQQMVDEETGKVVDKEHKGRGYELSKGRYVEIDEDELQAIEMESTHTVDIDSFVPLADRGLSTWPAQGARPWPRGLRRSGAHSRDEARGRRNRPQGAVHRCLDQ